MRFYLPFRNTSRLAWNKLPEVQRQAFLALATGDTGPGTGEGMGDG